MPAAAAPDGSETRPRGDLRGFLWDLSHQAFGARHFGIAGLFEVPGLSWGRKYVRAQHRGVWTLLTFLV